MHIGGRAALEAARRRAGRAVTQACVRRCNHHPPHPRRRRRRVRTIARRAGPRLGGDAAGGRRALARQPLRRIRRRGHQDADRVSHRRGDGFRSPAVGGGEFAWDASHSGDRVVGVPQRRTDDGDGLPWLRRELESAGRHRTHRVAARQRRRHRRARHRGAAHLRARAGRHAAGQRGHRAEPHAPTG